MKSTSIQSEGFMKKSFKKFQKNYNDFKSVDRFRKKMGSSINIGSPKASKTLTITEFGFFVVPIKAGVVYGVTITTKLANLFREKSEVVFRKKHFFKKHSSRV